MSAIGGPNVVDDSLAFYYDVNNVKSYKGEPTTNIVTNPTFLGTPNTQTSAIADNWYFSGDTSATGFRFYDSATSPIPLKFPDEGTVITTGPNVTTNRRIYYNGTVEPNTTYTLSYWFYSSNYGAVSNYFFTYKADGTGTTSPSYGQGFTTGQWVFIQQSFTTPADTGNTRNVNWGPVISSGTNSLFAMQRFQIEAKPHVTSFVNGTRSATQGLLDLTGNSTIDIGGTSFNASSEIFFDGTDDWLLLTRRQYAVAEAWTAELIVNPSDAADTSWNGIFGGDLNVGGYWMFHGGGNLTYYEGYWNPTTKIAYTGLLLGNHFPANTNKHLTITYDGAGRYNIYINGAQAGGFNWTHTGTYSLDLRYVGGPAARYGTVQVPLMKMYDGTLTPTQISSNFNAIRSRFNI